MAVIFIDGFDKYGPNGVVSGTAAVSAMLVSEWTLVNNAIPGLSENGSLGISAGLSSTGYSVLLSGSASLWRTLPTNYSRIIGGIRFQSNLSGTSGITLSDANVTQVSIMVNQGTGTVSILGYNGYLGYASTAFTIAQTLSSVKANSIHYLEWDITIGPAGAYTVWMDGVILFSGTANTGGGTGGTYCNQFVVQSSGSASFDDLYVFSSTGATNNAVLLTNPRIETQFPVADYSVGFVNGGTVLGDILSTDGNGDYVYNNYMHLIQVTPPVNMTINSLLCESQSSPVDNWTGVIYSDSGGVAHTLLAQTVSTPGITGSPFELNLITPLNLTAGTPYWIGFMFQTNTVTNTDARTAVVITDNLLHGVSASVTYGNPPTTAPTMQIAKASYMFFGYCSNVAHNWASEDMNPPPGDTSFVSSSTPGAQDLYLFPNLTTNPTAIYTVAVKSYARLTDTGNRSISLVVQSGSTSSTGSSAAQIPATSYQWADSIFDTDPNTNAAWTKSGLDAAQTGIKVAT